MKWVNNVAVCALFSWVMLAIPSLVLLHAPAWQENQCQKIRRCASVPPVVRQVHYKELQHFLQHRGQLESAYWKQQERYHFEAVRRIADFAVMFSALALAGVITRMKQKLLKQAVVVHLLMLLLLAIGICFFPQSWRSVHQWLFTGQHWLNGPDTLSYFIFPRELFFRSALAVWLCNGVVLLLVTGIMFHFSRPDKYSGSNNS